MEARVTLKAKRRECGMSQEQLAEVLGASVGAVRDWEQGRRQPQPGTRPALAKALDLTLPKLALILDGKELVEAMPTAQREVVPGWLNIFAGLEQTATTLRAYEPTVLPGLVQTPSYAEAILRADIADRSDADIARLVRLRLDRQDVLTRSPEPLWLSAVFDEVALRRVAGGPGVMADQLDHLAAMAMLPNVELRVLPFASGAHSIGFGAFQILAWHWGAETVYLENRASAAYLEGVAEVEAHAAVFAELERLALSPSDTIAFVRAARAGL